MIYAIEIKSNYREFRKLYVYYIEKERNKMEKELKLYSKHPENISSQNFNTTLELITYSNRYLIDNIQVIDKIKTA